MSNVKVHFRHTNISTIQKKMQSHMIAYNNSCLHKNTKQSFYRTIEIFLHI